MKTILAMLLGASLAVAAPAVAAPQPASAARPTDHLKLSEARAIIAIMFPPAQREHMMDKLMNDLMVPFRKNMPKAIADDPGLKAIVDDFISEGQARERPIIQKDMPHVLEAMAIAYTHEFSLAELKQIHAFALSPTGNHYLSKSIDIAGDPVVIEANTAMFADGQKMMNSLLPEFMSKVVEYVTAHPDLEKKVKATPSA